MCLLIETIRIGNGKAFHLKWHERRMEKARNEYWPGSNTLDLGEILKIPVMYSSGLVRCNITYGIDISEIQFTLYERKVVKSLKLVYSEMIDYHVKFLDRSSLHDLRELRGTCDDILIIKDGLVTDTSMSNIIFYDGKDWHTPEHPLLKGTCRERLLAEGAISATEIYASDIHRFAGCKLINAMRYPEEEEMIPISQLIT